MQDKVKPIRGFYRLQIVDPDGEVAADSGLQENVITNIGFESYLLKAICGGSAAGQITHIGLGSSSGNRTFAAADSSVDAGLTCGRATVGTSLSGSRTASFTAAFASNTMAGTYNINEIGLFNHSTSHSAFALASYAASTVQTNQAVNITYNIVLASST